MKPLTQTIRTQIQSYIKNGLDISDLIKDLEIQGENFNYAKIKQFHRVNANLSNCSFYQCEFGGEGFITSFIGCTMTDCNFEKAKFLGKVIVRNCDCRRSVFRQAWLPNVEYQFSDFRNCTFCHAVLRIGTEEGMGSKWDAQFLRDLTKYWNVEITVKDKTIGNNG